MMMTLLDDEQILKAYTRDIKDTVATETAIATAKATATETAKRMMPIGKLSLEEIALCVPSLSFDELKKIQAETQTA